MNIENWPRDLLAWSNRLKAMPGFALPADLIPQRIANSIPLRRNDPRSGPPALNAKPISSVLTPSMNRARNIGAGPGVMMSVGKVDRPRNPPTAILAERTAAGHTVFDPEYPPT